MVLRILSLAKFTPKKSISIPHEIANILDVGRGDELLFILDKNGNIVIKKYKGELLLEKGENYISSNVITASYPKGYESLDIYLNTDIRKILDVNIGDYLLLSIDKNENIILMNTIFHRKCTREFINKEITCIVIGLTTIYQNSLYLPKDLFEILGDIDVIFLCKYVNDNIIVRKDFCDNLLEEAKISFYYKTPSIRFVKKISSFLNMENIDKILWIFDEEGNILIRKAILPDNCINY